MHHKLYLFFHSRPIVNCPFHDKESIFEYQFTLKTFDILALDELEVPNATEPCPNQSDHEASEFGLVPVVLISY
jgi:hypothetical protein